MMEGSVSVLDRVTKVLVEDIGLDEGSVVPSACLKDDLGVDSTEMVEVVVALEKEFGVNIPDVMLKGGTKVGDLVDMLAGRVAK